MDLFEIRKELHRIPEPGFGEMKTTEYLLQILHKFTGLEIITFDFPGILVVYRCNDQDYKLFRADMDALPIEERTGCDFSSQNKGFMHACGHDMHMTILLGLIEKVLATKPDQNLLFLFQPAEEGQGGAERILQTGILENYKISEVFALHVNGHLPVGTISSRKGLFFANTQELKICLKGRSAHVAFPQTSINALAAGARFYLKLKDHLQQKFPDAKRVICEFGKMQAGSVMNAIASDCTFEGTIRAFEKPDMALIKQTIENVLEEIDKEYGTQSEVIYKKFYMAVRNSEHLNNKLQLIADDLRVRFQKSEAVFTGEDFGYFTQKYPGLLFWLGVSKDKLQNLHADDFLPDEKAIPIGIQIFYKFIVSD